MLDRDWSLSGKNGRSGLVAMVYVVATRGKLLKGTSREQAFLQKRPVAIKHFCERDQSRSQITTSNYKLNYHHLCRCFIPLHCIFILWFQFKTFPEMKNLSVVTMGEVYEAKHGLIWEINTGWRNIWVSIESYIDPAIYQLNSYSTYSPPVIRNDLWLILPSFPRMMMFFTADHQHQSSISSI